MISQFMTSHHERSNDQSTLRTRPREVRASLTALGLDSELPEHFEHGLRFEVRKSLAMGVRSFLAVIVSGFWTIYLTFWAAIWVSALLLEPRKNLPPWWSDSAKAITRAPAKEVGIEILSRVGVTLISMIVLVALMLGGYLTSRMLRGTSLLLAMGGDWSGLLARPDGVLGCERLRHSCGGAGSRAGRAVDLSVGEARGLHRAAATGA
ncbi:hypothetical protein [Streptomyces sp. NPDC093111]|uniref:hypothetical protein n=1 Tax=Streptomyces sp. NPDC093111 TaxID=3154978 RepID=UPI003421515D